MNASITRQWSLSAVVTPADALSSGSINLEIKNDLAPVANQVLTGEISFHPTNPSSAHRRVDLRYWTSYYYSGFGASYATGFTGEDVNGNCAAAGPANAYFRELWLSAPPVPNFSYYQQYFGVSYNPMVVYVQNHENDFSNGIQFYPGSFMSFGGLTQSEQGQAFGDPKYLYITSLHGGAVSHEYPPTLEVLQTREIR